MEAKDEADAALTELISALDNDDPLVREIAIESFHEMGRQGRESKRTADSEAAQLTRVFESGGRPRAR